MSTNWRRPTRRLSPSLIVCLAASLATLISVSLSLAAVGETRAHVKLRKDICIHIPEAGFGCYDYLFKLDAFARVDYYRHHSVLYYAFDWDSGLPKNESVTFRFEVLGDDVRPSDADHVGTCPDGQQYANCWIPIASIKVDRFNAHHQQISDIRKPLTLVYPTYVRVRLYYGGNDIRHVIRTLHPSVNLIKRRLLSIPPGAMCGDGVLTADEECDSPMGSCPSGLSCIECACDCGNCDDGNSCTDDQCTESGCVHTLTASCAAARMTPILSMLAEGDCGDGTIDDSEQCDDGNTVNGDGCSSACTME